jgi:hypothetical protein
MQSLNKTAIIILFTFMALSAVYAQSEIAIFWEIRNYYIDADNPQVEVFLVIDNSVKKKEFIFFDSGEAAEIPESGQYKLSTWFGYTTYEYRCIIENKNIRIQKQKVEYSKEIQDFKSVPPGWADFKKIPVAAGKIFIPKADVAILAKKSFLPHTLILNKKNEWR